MLCSHDKPPFLISWSSSGIYVIDPVRDEVVLWNNELKGEVLPVSFMLGSALNLQIGVLPV